MNSATDYIYDPEIVSAPGETLQEVIEERGLSQAELGQRTGRPQKTISEIIGGKAALTNDTAIQLETVLGIPAEFWNQLESNYREYLARTAEQSRLVEFVDWADKFPITSMVKRGWTHESRDPVRRVSTLLRFFGVNSPQEWAELYRSPQVAFRQSKAFEASGFALSAWLRKGELEAAQISCEPFAKSTFRSSLREIRKMTFRLKKNFDSDVVELCAEAGVALVFVPELPKSRVSGATRWLTNNKAMVQLSLRYKTDDQLFFTLFHEAAHVLRHSKKRWFIEVNGPQDELELEADKFASRWLISNSDYRELLQSDYSDCAVIEVFAAKIEIAPGIVVGRLQHDGYIDYSNCNFLKRKLEWSEPANR